MPEPVIRIFLKPEIEQARGFEYRESAKLDGSDERVSYTLEGLPFKRENGRFFFELKGNHSCIPLAFHRFVDHSRPIEPVSAQLSEGI